MNKKTQTSTEVDGLFAIADALNDVAGALNKLGIGGSQIRRNCSKTLGKISQRIYECSVCHERIDGSDESPLRDHLERHNGNARDMDWVSVRNSYTLEEDE